MKLIPDGATRSHKAFGPKLCLLLLGPAFVFLIEAQAASNIVLWDTGAPVKADSVEDRGNWNGVPDDFLTLEANPPKASSDPGYYGREYSFKGDAVVENRKFLAFFWTAKGRMVLYSKTGSGLGIDSSLTNAGALTKVLELGPSLSKTEAAPFGHVEILRNVEDEVVLQIAFQNAPAASLILGFGRTEIIEVKPSAGLKMTLAGSFEYGIVPSFIGDDLIFGAEVNRLSNMIYLPVQNFFLGLLKGEASEVVMSWPTGKQKVRIGIGDEQNGRRSFDSIDFDADGQSFYLAALCAPGIWHKEVLTPAFLEKDVPINWRKPFAARWKTQLYEEALKTTFAFKETKGDVWRGVPGSYAYPVWFDGEQALFHLSKKVPPKGESVIYFLEGQGTPESVDTPVDIFRATVGRPIADPILDVAGRKLRTHHRRGGEGVHRACTCGCTEAIQAVFEAGEEVARKDDIKGDLEDMMYFVHQHVDRINEYRRFSDELMKFLEAKKTASPELGQYLESLKEIIQQIPREYDVQKENMKTFAYADGLVVRTVALTDKKDSNNLKAYMDLLKEWRAMGGAQDYVLAQCHTITRRLAQEAGYGCVEIPTAVSVAMEVRARARQILRNPDGYEIWADY